MFSKHPHQVYQTCPGARLALTKSLLLVVAGCLEPMADRSACNLPEENTVKIIMDIDN